MLDQQKQIIDKCHTLFAKVKELYGLDLSRVVIRFDLKGRAAGQASRRSGIYYIRFNHDMLSRDAFDHLLNETVPHEIAHIVCFINPRLGRNHDIGWYRVCVALGGSGKTTHDEEVVHGKGNTYEYITSAGVKVRVGQKHHDYLQRGGGLTWRKGKGKVQGPCEYWIVGVSGRSLPTPIRKQPTAVAGASYVIIRNATTEIKPATVTAGRAKSALVAAFVTAATPDIRTNTGESKAAISRRIMLSYYKEGRQYEEIINAMIAANGYNRQLARATFKANAPKIGIPESFC